ncbi:hypothetical protein SOVF_006530 [Spinacia oleracea]|nr:hypothetical protein SOVF_006530 [Spinacia oleracea]
MEVEEPWDALDTDDTDLSFSASLLRRCSNQPRPSILPSQPSHHSSSPPPPPPVSSQQQPSSTATLSPPGHRIPGPAAAIQAAMHRKNRFNCDANQAPDISTQEYIRRVEEDFGEEFSRNPWVFAIDFLRSDGVFDTITPLRAIKKCVNAERFDKVVAIVKSCTPNGLGDMMVTLKDPTDTISASVHGKVLSVGELGRSITVGSVLILQKVVAFPSSCMSCYLNITRSNIDKAISVDCEVQNFTEGYPDSTRVFCENSVIPEKTSSLVSRRIESVVGGVHRHSTLKGKEVIAELTGKENYTQLSSLNSSRQIKNAADKTFDEPIDIDLVDSGRSASGCYTSQPGPGLLEGTVRNLDNDEKHRRQVRELSSAPSMIENLGDKNWWENGAQDKRPLRGSNCNMSITEKPDTVTHGHVSTSSRTLNNVDDLDMSRGISSAPGMVENQAKRDMSEIIGSLRSMQRTETGANTKVVEKQDDQEPSGANGVKKQRLGLISRIAVQEWTDEQLCILDMDED